MPPGEGAPGAARSLSVESAQQRPARRHRDRSTLEVPLELLEGYQVLGELGRGAHGQVRAAIERSSGAARALKIIPLGPHTPEAEREVLAQLSLEHPCLLRCYHAGVLDQVAFLVLEPADSSLEDWLEEPDALERGWWALGRIAKCLEWLHGQGIVHRDVKPSNILLTPEGAKLADLGLATGGALGWDSGEEARGTPAYMAPEQARGEPMTPASDIFSLAVTYHRLLTGRFPFPERDALGQLFSLARGHVVPDGETLSKLPTRVRELLLAALSPDPAERPENLAELAEVALPAHFGRPRRVLEPGQPRERSEFGDATPEERFLEHGFEPMPLQASPWLPVYLVAGVLAFSLLLLLAPH